MTTRRQTNKQAESEKKGKMMLNILLPKKKSMKGDTTA